MDFNTADICDDNMKENLQILAPNFKNYGGKKKCRGEVITIKLDKSNWGLIDLLKSGNGEGKIIVVDNAEYFFGVVGDKLMALAKENNWAGFVINGFVRDIEITKDIDVLLYALGTCPLRNFEKTKSELGAQLSFGGVTFNNKNYLYADDDGILLCQKNLL